MKRFKRDKINGFYNNTRIANEIRNLACDPKTAKQKYVDSLYSVDVGGKGHRVTVRFMLSRVLSVMDCVVLDAATALYIAGYTEFSAADLAEFMYGSKKARRKDISENLDRLCKNQIFIDITEEMEMRSGKGGDEYKEQVYGMKNRWEKDGGCYLKGVLLPLKETAVTGGKCRYRFIKGKVPALYEYASVVNSQHKLYSPKLAEALESARSTERLLLERYYLIGKLAELYNYKSKEQKGYDPARIEINNEDKPGNILFHLTWSKAQVLGWSDTQLSHRRDEVFEELQKLLEHFKQAGEITDYSAAKSRGERSVTIEL